MGLACDATVVTPLMPSPCAVPPPAACFLANTAARATSTAFAMAFRRADLSSSGALPCSAACRTAAAPPQGCGTSHMGRGKRRQQWAARENRGSLHLLYLGGQLDSLWFTGHPLVFVLTAAYVVHMDLILLNVKVHDYSLPVSPARQTSDADAEIMFNVVMATHENTSPTRPRLKK